MPANERYVFYNRMLLERQERDESAAEREAEESRARRSEAARSAVATRQRRQRAEAEERDHCMREVLQSFGCLQRMADREAGGPHLGVRDVLADVKYTLSRSVLLGARWYAMVSRENEEDEEELHMLGDYQWKCRMRSAFVSAKTMASRCSFSV